MSSPLGESALKKKFILNNGIQIPAVGVGTFRVRSEAAIHNLVDKSLQAGYRLFDTAAIYGNEVAVRNAFATLLPKYKLERADIFITSKLISIGKVDHKDVRKFLHCTLLNLGTDYIDLFLISFPSGSENNRRRTWETVQKLYDEGYVTAIGVSNYKVEHLKDITNRFNGPMVNQVEWHPLMHDDELYQYCRLNGILLQAYSPFGTPFTTDKRLLRHSVIKGIAGNYEVPTAQVVLMWSLQQGVAVVPLSTNTLHLVQNIRFQLLLSPQEIKLISAITPYTTLRIPNITKNANVTVMSTQEEDKE